jgi:hypothetical protein
MGALASASRQVLLVPGLYDVPGVVRTGRRESDADHECSANGNAGERLAQPRLDIAAVRPRYRHGASLEGVSLVPRERRLARPALLAWTAGTERRSARGDVTTKKGVHARLLSDVIPLSNAWRPRAAAGSVEARQRGSLRCARDCFAWPEGAKTAVRINKIHSCS